MLEQTVKVKNKLGIHARPAALFVQTTSQFKSEVYLSRGGLNVNGKSIMGVLMLAAEEGSSITIRVDGEDQEETMEKLVALIESKFGEN